MNWIEAAVHTTTAGADIVSELLMNAGATGTSIEDRTDVLNAQKPEGMWDMLDEHILDAMPEDVLVKAYFEEGASTPETLAFVRARLSELSHMDLGFDLGSLEFTRETVHEQDWAENWKRYYKPFRAGERIVVKPSWEPYEPFPEDLVIEMDPGMAFGTGTHETTYMCLQMLERYVRPGSACIDVGTGTGILAIAAAKLGAQDVLAIDLDEQAVAVAKENIQKNGMEQVVHAQAGDLLKDSIGKADVIVANIIADVICALCGPAKAHICPGGAFICSGIIREREEDVLRALRQAGYAVDCRIARGEWVCLSAKPL
ncbi:MAG TPA: 50S ribosomal protein L11 methyltransferase [Candidatus Onthenecus intestinigallinarum]|uniref:Ribosomal protein L11 methyltransferase n=1 Tax=Candidatus Onthenecus intestinigallinarum TaxID=2840875 RepID=A0A9D0ZAB9_9FIRM|nr:50S ribosomal protein L11 methyltransferase [Candidatus Onthenecus intestinigallinarum]